MAQLRLCSLTVYRGVLKTKIFRQYRSLLEACRSYDAAVFLTAYGELLSLCAGDGGFAVCAGLARAFLYDQNPFTSRPEAARELMAAAAADIGILRLLCSLSADEIKAAALEQYGEEEGTAELIRALPEWDVSCGGDTALLFSGDPAHAAAVLREFHSRNGCGEYARYGAFRWRRRDGRSLLEPVRSPDAVRLSELKDYEYEHNVVLENTVGFLEGRSANNILLYGDRGTGKSSTVKAVFNELRGRGLRIVEVAKENLGDFSALTQTLGSVPLKFIVFIDDLSFSAEGADYSSLKAVLEGGLAARPGNVVIYATSNRRHLVRESFSERDRDDVHAADNMQEKLSLSDRFGITVTFVAPDQKLYLDIVRRLAEDRGLTLPREELETGALRWALNYNGRSPRTARQYIDWLSGRKEAGTQV